jgi:hypothetical protein
MHGYMMNVLCMFYSFLACIKLMVFMILMASQVRPYSILNIEYSNTKGVLIGQSSQTLGLKPHDQQLVMLLGHEGFVLHAKGKI